MQDYFKLNCTDSTSSILSKPPIAEERKRENKTNTGSKVDSFYLWKMFFIYQIELNKQTAFIIAAVANHNWREENSHGS